MQKSFEFTTDSGTGYQTARRPKGQLLKWIGNKQRFALEICNKFPTDIRVYHEPFLGSGAILATLGHGEMVGSDVYEPLIEIWQCLATRPNQLVEWYQSRWHECHNGDPRAGYQSILQRFNESPNGADFVYLCRSCYGGGRAIQKS